MAAWVVNVARPQPLPWWGDYKAVKVQEAARKGLEVLTPAQAMEALKAGAWVFVDAREPDEFAAGHIPGAVNISAEALLTGLDAAAQAFPKDKP
ncbi:MAG: rhodanese-like domain-containing protein, partial [Acidobacteriota bacterium]